MTHEERIAEITDVATSGGGYDDLSKAAQEWLYDKYADQMPIGTAKARTGDPSQWMDENAMPDFVVGEPEHYDPCEPADGYRTPQEHGEVIAGKWCSDRDIQRAEMKMDELKGN